MKVDGIYMERASQWMWWHGVKQDMKIGLYRDNS